MIVNAFDRVNPTMAVNGQGPYAGNVEIDIVPVGNCQAELVAVSFTLTNDATVANRIPRIEFQQAALDVVIGFASKTAVASVTYKYAFVRDAISAQSTDANRYLAGFGGGLFSMTGWKYVLIIEGGVAGDAVSVINSVWRIWPDDH